MTEIKRILCPVDFSDASRHAIEHAIVIAGWYKSRITALHVHNPIFLPSAGLELAGYRDESELEDDGFKQVQGELAAFVQPAVVAGIGVDVRIESGPRIDDEPVRSNALRPWTPITMRSALSSVAIPRISRYAFPWPSRAIGRHQVVRRATCPVLTLRR